jgi:hypothetical protein
MCVEPYDYDQEEYSNILIVQGTISNSNGPYKVYLSRSIALREEKLIKEVNAIVSIIDQFGNIETLTEIEDGLYATDINFKSEIDNEYQLMITTSDMLEYVSEIVKLRKGPDIDSVFVEYKEQYNFEENKNEKGIDIKINTSDFNTDEDIFLKWDYEETWEIKQKWNAKEVDFKEIGDVEYFFLDQNTRSCWQVDYSYDIILDNLSTYSSDKIINKKILHLNESSPKPFYGYSILISQKTINKSVYEFWRFLKESNIENGDVFDNIPFNTKSNIQCCDDNGKVVGYFDASYISQKRMNLKSPIKNVEFKDFNESCIRHTTNINSFLTEPRNRPTFALYVIYNVLESRISYTSQTRCVDCSISSNLDEEPDFWIYK